jgi:hypothetical protein
MKPKSPPQSQSPHVSAEQLRYADWLDTGTRIGFLLLIATFCVYASGVLPPHVPLADLPKVWALPLESYLAAIGGPSGWGWLALVSRGDYLNFIGVAFLGGITIACYLRVLPMLVARRDRWFAAIAVLELVVLAAAASGLISGGH